MLLLDGEMSVVLRSERDELSTTRLQALERLPLRGYASTHLRRFLNNTVLSDLNKSGLEELAQLAIAFAIVLSKSTRRVLLGSKTMKSVDQISFEGPGQIQVWRIVDCGVLLLDGIHIDTAAV